MSSFSTATISASNHSPKYSDQTQSPTLNRDNSWGGGGKEEDMLQNHLQVLCNSKPHLRGGKYHFLAPISQMEGQIFNQLLRAVGLNHRIYY